MQTFVFLVCAVVAATAETCDPYYSDLCADHTMCIYPEVGEACGEVHYRGLASDAEIQEILEQHNKYRSKVALGHATRGNPGPQPSAANMNQLTYDDRLSWVAQRWSDQCLPKHDKCIKDSRFLGNIVGQNVFSWASMRTDDIIDANWTMAVESWFEEIQYFNPQDIDPFVFHYNSAHYTQLVWADTTLVGCGYTAHQTPDGMNHRHYVCNYGIGGNINSPGFSVYKVGEPCSACSDSCDSATGLCQH
ncbi:Venom allergen 5 [Blattella germanica]|nr:Venom allergen 5 [Blattella germanica]